MYHFCGLTNQVYMFLVTLHYALKTCRGVAVVYVGPFNTDIATGKRKMSMQDIMDFGWLRQMTPHVHFVDTIKPPPIRRIIFGKDAKKCIDLTAALRGKDIGKLMTGKCPLRKLLPNCPDPCPGNRKRLVITWADASCPPTILQEQKWVMSGLHKPEHLLFPKDEGGWRMLDQRLRGFRFHPSFYSLPFPLRSPDKQYAVIHLRNEKDAINHWSPRNKLPVVEYKKIMDDLYIHSIEKHVPKTFGLMILTAEPVGNVVIQDLKQKGWDILLCPKSFPGERELCAAQDLIWSASGDVQILLAPWKGSTFSHWLRQIVKARMNIRFDLDHVKDGVVVETS